MSDSAHTADRAARAYVCLGSNLGDRAGNLLLAVRGMIDAGFDVRRLSSVYETAPVDVLDQPAFLNMVAELRATSERRLPAPDALLARLLRIEYKLGRRRDANTIERSARTIDLDLLLYTSADGTRTSDTEFLRLPHPRLHLRRFVLVPLAEVAPDAMHPILRRTISDLLAATPDTSAVTLWSSRQ